MAGEPGSNLVRECSCSVVVNDLTQWKEGGLASDRTCSGAGGWWYG